MKYKKYDLESYQIYTIETDKFKTCYFEIKFCEDIRNVNLSSRFLLTQLLQYSSLKYPTRREVTIALEELYNASFASNISRGGYNHFSSFSIDFLHPRYVKEKEYLDQILAFLFQAILKPNIKQGIFEEKTIQVLKERIHVLLDQYKEKPLSFARRDSLEKLFKESISGKSLYGNHEQLEKITNEDLVLEYQKMFQNSRCDILIIGNLNMDEVVEKIKKIFYKPSIVLDNIPAFVENPISTFHEEKIKSSYNQTQLLEYYQAENLTDFEKNYVAPLFSRIFGNANMTDKLTKYLRIENSLCYYCGSIIRTSDSYLLVYVGLNKKEVKKGIQLIHKAFKEMVKKEIDEKYFEKQKEKYLADLNLREDDMYGLIDMYYFHETLGLAMNEDYLENIPKVTLQDIQKFAKKFELTYRYILEERDE